MLQKDTGLHIKIESEEITSETDMKGENKIETIIKSFRIVNVHGGIRPECRQHFYFKAICF